MRARTSIRALDAAEAEERLGEHSPARTGHNGGPSLQDDDPDASWRL